MCLNYSRNVIGSLRLELSRHSFLLKLSNLEVKENNGQHFDVVDDILEILEQYEKSRRYSRFPASVGKSPSFARICVAEMELL